MPVLGGYQSMHTFDTLRLGITFNFIFGDIGKMVYL